VTATTLDLGGPVTSATPVTKERLRWLPLTVILAAQAVLSARLTHTGIASHDEALYITAGHQLIHELWHGGGSPYYETHFSGAPVLYPILAALADHVGGLAAVRLMSTVFMAGATCLSYLAGRRLFGWTAGITSAALFAGLGLTQDLGAYATYDALALMLVAFAGYCAVRSAGDDARWLLAIPAALLAANAVKYATLAFDPVVIAVAATQRPWGREALRRAGVLVCITAGLSALALLLAGTAYVKGLMFTTLTRHPGSDSIIGAVQVSPHLIATETVRWLGAVLALAAIAIVICLLAGDRRRLATLATLTLAGLLVTAEALRLHSDESMRKHDDIGAWFACLAAGYAVSRIGRWARGRYGRIPAAILVALAVVVLGIHYSLIARSSYEATQHSAYEAAFPALRPYIDRGGRYLVGGEVEDQLPYTDGISIPWWDFSNDVYLKYPVPGRGGDAHGQTPGRSCLVLRPGCMYLEYSAAFSAAIHAHWFALVTLIGSHHIPQDSVIERAVAHTHGYVLLTELGGAPTWIYARDYPKGMRHLRL
jgi:4-amino-4-deoxy-L-arabinose transferase-like glycosyltransferase